MSERAHDYTREPRERSGPAEPAADDFAGQAYQPEPEQGAGVRPVPARDRLMEGADKAKDRAATGIESIAERLREQAGDREGLPAQASEKVASGMEKTAGYLKEGDTQQMVQDLEGFVRSHPMQALGGAIAAGFVIGRILR
jgi:ElaB/YqjD/DUF883 family membrane-anchored ribosome-binding protein